MKNKPNLMLLIILIMFPQFVETIYSPALPNIAQAFQVSNQQASLTLSFYFIAFALGVIFWGILSDIIGRRSAMILGLFTYAIGAFMALLTKDFNIILFARVVAAFGASVGSIITQTILRDVYRKEELGYVFSIIGIALSLSPIIGFMAGGFITKGFGYHGVFMVVLLVAVLLSISIILLLPETKPQLKRDRPKVGVVLLELLHDRIIWLSALLVALFNIMLFSYYSLAPFIFEQSGHSATQFGYSGILLAIGSLAGGVLNKKLIHLNFSAHRLIYISSAISIIGALGIFILQGSLWFLFPMLFILIAFSIAIPNILSQALIKYKDVVGTAGALFGLLYYTLIGLGLTASGWIQDFGLVLIISSLLAILFAGAYKKSTSRTH
ncbi:MULTISPECIES: multidrug effflux MFS transporter [Sphingobacterium]|uniref:multidrug effflux MFS transporter n=1 Tax=Sphingobacterium TaxID=28453 RepID=UPI00104B6635|nr:MULTISPECIES: multidrug effflux MFS transporter [Sphingobacterium]MCW2263007.1 Bcr/CflA subfamily drug resistance transporter [Sphingobacterium kitahiroshimense]TCR12003.1 Bcr/CflA subfamily drug resistance transporter [Sphingobacterium sp. JUb78]